jgi:DNA-binding response OmpR family regulator
MLYDFCAGGYRARSRRARRTPWPRCSPLTTIRTHRPDLLIADINMPILDGFSLVRRLRDQGDPLPVILLTARNHEIDEAMGLELGADDYITKPYSSRLLLARVAALVRREQLRLQPPTEPVMVRGLLDICAERLEVRVRGQPVHLTVSEFRLVEALVRRPGVVLSRDRLLDQVRGEDTAAGERIIDTYVRRVRRKFEAVDPHFAELETVVGLGYRWVAHD